MPIEKELKNIKKDVSLAPFTTFKIGGRAKYFFVAHSQQQIIEALEQAQKYHLPFFILGGGSNLLVSDKGFDGLVIKIQNSKIERKDSSIIAEAGANLAQLLTIAKNSGLSGLEWAAGIPGTVGGALRGNSGAFGKSIADLVRNVRVFDISTRTIKNYSTKDCLFGYRESIFKKNKELVILSGEFVFDRDSIYEIEKRMKRYLEYRKAKQPLECFSAGCIFKNPEGFSAGKLIEKCSLKGKRKGGAQISKKHGNFIINLGNATSQDVMFLITLAKEEVKRKFGIELEEEIEFLGF